jgi:hypothetical protein
MSISTHFASDYFGRFVDRRPRLVFAAGLNEIGAMSDGPNERPERPDRHATAWIGCWKESSPTTQNSATHSGARAPILVADDAEALRRFKSALG